MKVKVAVLSLLVPVLLVAEIVNAAEIYNENENKLDFFGKIYGLRYFSDSFVQNGDQTYMKIGLKGETKINNQLVGYGRLEYHVQCNSDKNENNSFPRVSLVGLRFGNLGSFDYGRNHGVVYDVTSWTDVVPEFGGDTYSSGCFMQQIDNGFMTYRNTNFFGLIDGLNFAIQYKSKNSNEYEDYNVNSNNRISSKQKGIGGSITYDLGEGFSIGSAISKYRYSGYQNDVALGLVDQNETYTSALKYDANNIYLAAQYTKTHSEMRRGDSEWANKSKNIEVVAQYQFNCGLRPSVAYLQSRGKDLNNIYNKQDILKYVDVGATYSFNKNMSAYFDYKINLLNENNFTRQSNINTNNVFALGLIYQF